MKHEVDLKNLNIRTDLITESLDKIKDKTGININNYINNNIEVEEVYVDSNASINNNIKEGNYISLLFDDITDVNNRKNLINEFVKVLKKLLIKKNLSIDKSCLIIGLGNSKSTPDSLGPKVADSVIVTRYISLVTTLDKNYRITSSFSPSVFGSSGIETSDIVCKLKEIVKPDFIIVIDALKAMNINKVNKVIQISDIGISPGSGVGNKRKEISKDSLGIDVISIGVPTVTDLSTIISDTIKYLYKKISYTKENLNNPLDKLKTSNKINYLKGDIKELSTSEKKQIMGLIGTLTEDELKVFIQEVLEPIGYNLIVTVKEIDFIIKNLTEVLTTGLNKSLHNIS